MNQWKDKTNLNNLEKLKLNLVSTVFFLFSLHNMIRSNTTINTTNNSEVENPKFYLKNVQTKHSLVWILLVADGPVAEVYSCFRLDSGLGFQFWLGLLIPDVNSDCLPLTVSSLKQKWLTSCCGRSTWLIMTLSNRGRPITYFPFISICDFFCQIADKINSCKNVLTGCSTFWHKEFHFHCKSVPNICFMF